MTHVFISYSRQDTDFVEKLERALQARSIVMWRDVHSIPGGAKWFRRIKQGLESSYAMIYIDTESAEKSDWVEREFLYAQHLNLPIIPAKYAPSFMSFQMINLNPILCDEVNFEAGVEQIVTRLSQLEKKPIKPNTVPPPMSDRTETAFDADWATNGDDETIATIDYTEEVLSYVDWLLVQSKADLRDALYVNLEAQADTKLQPKDDNPFSFGLDLGMDFEPLGLEHIHDEAFDKAGEAVPDARVPVTEHQRVILLGEPGSGKTTTLLQLAVDLARQVQADPDNALVPVFVPLRKYDGRTTFEQFVRQQMFNFQDAYEDLLAQGKLIFLLDALNEMPRTSEDGRDLVADVRGFAEEKARWVVSCRVRDYQEELKDISDVGKVRLQPLDPPRIKDVILRRYREQFKPQGLATEADGQALWEAMYGTDDLLKAWQVHVTCGKPESFWELQWDQSIKPEDKDYVWNTPGYYDWGKMARDKRRMMHLCRNPYMTNMVSMIYARSKALPDNRGALFKLFVDQLLKRDEQLAKSVGAKWIDDTLIRKGLSQIAYRMGAETEMPRTRASSVLRETLPDTDTELLLRIAQGASLLDVGQDVRFTHQLLQEYFASEVMGAFVDDRVDSKTIWKPDSWWKPTGREETAIILAGVRGDPESIARWIAPAQPEFAIQVLQDSGVQVDLEGLEPVTRQAILDSANAKRDTIDPVRRAAAYRVLGLLNADKRSGIGLRLDGLPDIEWVKIPAGDYRTETIDYDFEIARYPVTYAQFQTFVDDSDGLNSQTYNWFDGLAADDSDKQLREQSFKYANHPRESVNWYQAMAFCRWLSFKLGGGYGLDDVASWLVRLPTEYEWEKAARYPDAWRNDYQTGMANINETRNEIGSYNLGQTTAVGMYPPNPLGIYDLTGNVWEWCLSDYANPAEHPKDEDLSTSTRRVFRGGSWLYLNAFNRYGYFPNSDRSDRGFRVCRPPSQSG